MISLTSSGSSINQCFIPPSSEEVTSQAMPSSIQAPSGLWVRTNLQAYRAVGLVKGSPWGSRPWCVYPGQMGLWNWALPMQFSIVRIRWIWSKRLGFCLILTARKWVHCLLLSKAKATISFDRFWQRPTTFMQRMWTVFPTSLLVVANVPCNHDLHFFFYRPMTYIWYTFFFFGRYIIFTSKFCPHKYIA